MYNRKPLPRKNGKYSTHDVKDKLNGIDEYAQNVAHELITMYPDVDIIDIEYIFTGKLGFRMAYENMKASEGE